MRCLLCQRWSFSHICFTCKDQFLQPSIYKRKILNNIEVISFYKYQDIKDLIHTKHADVGYYIYTILANIAFKKLANSFVFNENVASIAIDDRAKNSYSHTAILNKSLKSKHITPLTCKLRSTSDVTYSAKTYEERLRHPRNFIVKKFKQKNIILVDDIITTGLTLTQGCSAMQKKGKDILFCLALADAQE